MNRTRIRITQVALASAIAAASLSMQTAFAAGEVLRSGDVSQMHKWYGHAGGLVGSDRVEALSKPTGDRVGISYDAEVAKRTNMQREGASPGGVGITYDKDVASRTNMQRDVPPTQSAGTPATPRN